MLISSVSGLFQGVGGQRLQFVNPLRSDRRRSIRLAEGAPPVFPLGSLDGARDATGLGMPDVPVAGQQTFQLNRKVGDLTSDLTCLPASLSHQGCIFDPSLFHF